MPRPFIPHRRKRLQPRLRSRRLVRAAIATAAVLSSASPAMAAGPSPNRALSRQEVATQLGMHPHEIVRIERKFVAQVSERLRRRLAAAAVQT